jgi:hypothetical protein
MKIERAIATENFGWAVFDNSGRAAAFRRRSRGAVENQGTTCGWAARRASYRSSDQSLSPVKAVQRVDAAASVANF